MKDAPGDAAGPGAESGGWPFDPRALLIATAGFIAVVLSFERTEISSLVPLAGYPVALGVAGRASWTAVARRLLVAAPFMLLFALPPLWLDRSAAARLGGWVLTGGALDALSLLLRFSLTVSALVVLVAVAGMPALCAGLRRLGVPAVLVVQLGLAQRYLSVIGAEASRMVRAHRLRSGRHGRAARVAYGSLVGHLLLRALDRTSRVHMAMCCRGFTGEMPTTRALRWRPRDAALLGAVAVLLASARGLDLPEILGRWLMSLGRAA